MVLGFSKLMIEIGLDPKLMIKVNSQRVEDGVGKRWSVYIDYKMCILILVGNLIFPSQTFVNFGWKLCKFWSFSKCTCNINYTWRSTFIKCILIVLTIKKFQFLILYLCSNPCELGVLLLNSTHKSTFLKTMQHFNVTTKTKQRKYLKFCSLKFNLKTKT